MRLKPVARSSSLVVASAASASSVYVAAIATGLTHLSGSIVSALLVASVLGGALAIVLLNKRGIRSFEEMALCDKSLRYAIVPAMAAFLPVIAILAFLSKSRAEAAIAVSFAGVCLASAVWAVYERACDRFIAEMIERAEPATGEAKSSISEDESH